MISFSTKALKSLLLTSLALAVGARAEINLAPLLANLPIGTSTSVIAKNLDTQQVIVDYQSQQFMLPASTEKVFTALASKLILAEDFRFQTAFLSSGKIDQGILDGNLIAKFTGDPSLTSTQLRELVQKLKKQGLRKINGDLIIDASVFTSHDKAAGWVWNDLPICFSAPSAAANIDANCFYINLNANQPEGSPITVDKPSVFPVEIENNTYVATKGEAGYCELDAEVSQDNRYRIRGCLARQDKSFGLSFAVQNPTLYTSKVLQDILKRAEIELTGTVQITTKAQQGQLLAEHYSIALNDLLKKMMKKSDNLIADSLFRTVGNAYYARPTSYPMASQAMRRILKDKAGIDFGNSIVADGSGLSRYNQISAQTMLSALEVIAKNEELLHLFDTFPIAGVDGSISGRGSISQAPLANNMMAKTGSLKGVYNLAGFMKNARGERIAFVQFINGYSTGEFEQKTKRTSLNRFENGLYMALYNE